MGEQGVSNTIKNLTSTIKTLNLSYNTIGPNSVSLLKPIMEDQTFALRKILLNNCKINS